MDETVLHIPDGINFECTGCGNCCFNWPVPVTQEDVQRIQQLVPGAPALFRARTGTDKKLAVYTHTLEKRADGRCQFLTEDNRCQLHIDHGPAAKPAMCQLFPYTFTPTPSGIYASVSFASTGVLYNSGAPLVQQSDLLGDRWRLFNSLMPDFKPDWSSLQLVDGVALLWSDYLQMESELLSLFHPGHENESASLLSQMVKASQIAVDRLPDGHDVEKNLTDARPKAVDQILIHHLLEFYFPADVFSTTAHDLPARDMAAKLVTPPNKVRIECGGKEVSVVKLLDEKLGPLAPDCDSLLRRFIYCRLFSKLYCGPGYNNLSLLAGLHHLFFIVALIRMQLKLTAFHQQSDREQFMQLAELVRKAERRLTVVSFSRESATILEVLLTSPDRLARILALAA
jgi:Fe-S-cluster containining protein